MANLAIEVTLSGEECRHLLGEVVPESARAVSVTVTARGCSHGTPSGQVQVSYHGRKPDGTPHKRRTGTWWPLTQDWWDALVKNNTKLPTQQRMAADDAVREGVR